MAAGLSRPPSVENVSSVLSAGISDVATSFDVGDASEFTSPGYYVIDRVDSSGTPKDISLWEYIKITNIASNTLTVTRGQSGSTNQSHSSGAVIEAVVTAAHETEHYNSLNPEHTASGGHVITGTMTIAGMNLASVATIAAGSFGHLRANASTSGTGLSLNPVWFASGFASGATTNVARLIMPRAGTFRYFTMTTRTPVSTASLNVTLFNGGASIFNLLTVPTILGGNSFMSTASILAPNFTAGQVITMDVVTGGNVADITLMGSAY